jgi:serine/threonine protein kinase
VSAGGLEPVAALQAFYEVTRAVEFAHAVGVAHGGISPANVIVDASGRPFLVDLGAARLRARFRPSDATPVPTLSSPISDVRALVHLFRTMMEEGSLLRPIDPSIDPLLAECAALMATFETAREMAEAVGRVLTAMPQHSTSVGLMEKFRRSKDHE